MDSYHEILRLKILLGGPIGIEPASPAFWAGVLTTTPQHPGTKCIKFASSSNPWQLQLVLLHMLLLIQCFHTMRGPPILLYRHYSPDQLIGRTRGPITRDLSLWSPCPADQRIRRVMPVQQYRWQSHSVKTL